MPKRWNTENEKKMICNFVSEFNSFFFSYFFHYILFTSLFFKYTRTRIATTKKMASYPEQTTHSKASPLSVHCSSIRYPFYKGCNGNGSPSLVIRIIKIQPFNRGNNFFFIVNRNLGRRRYFFSPWFKLGFFFFHFRTFCVWIYAWRSMWQFY